MLQIRLGYLFCDDLMWSSRVAATARALGVQIKPVRSLQQLEERVKEAAPAVVIIDLGVQGVNVSDVVAQVTAVCGERPRFAAYGSHVDVAGLQAARDAGCDPVLPRSKFSQDMESLLAGWFGAGTRDSNPT